MDNSKELMFVTFTVEEFRSARLFLKSINIAKLGQNLDTDDLSDVISSISRIMKDKEAATDMATATSITISLTREDVNNFTVFLQNLNMGRLQNVTDTITLALAVIQVAQALGRAEVAGEEDGAHTDAVPEAEPDVHDDTPHPISVPRRRKSNEPTPIREEALTDD